MLESRKSYGWGGTGVTPKEELKKWVIYYRTDDGGLGEIGWKTFTDYNEAVAYGEEFKAEKGYVTKIIVRHPSKIYSTY